MKLLFDQNLAPRLARRLADLFPNSVHVIDVGLDAADDRAVWAHATLHDFAIVSKDADFAEMATIRGTPPKVLWIRRGNCPAIEIETLLRNAYDDVRQFLADPHSAVLELF